MHSQEFRAGVLIFVLSLAYVFNATPALARTDFDGDWSIFIITREGACEATLRYGVKVVDGTVINDGGGIAAVRGQVTPRGAVRVIVRSGGQWANGSGHLSRNHGGGIWKGQGMSGTCAGTWMAERRQ
jgi:hypothetical protein